MIPIITDRLISINDRLLESLILNHLLPREIRFWTRYHALLPTVRAFRNDFPMCLLPTRKISLIRLITISFTINSNYHRTLLYNSCLVTNILRGKVRLVKSVSWHRGICILNKNYTSMNTGFSILNYVLNIMNTLLY